MKTNSSPSRYRYCISRLSTLATSTRTPALKVRSTTFPLSTFFSLVRTNAPPLPGLTCWKSTTLQSWPSMLRVMPFLRSFVVATSVVSPACGRDWAHPGSQDEQFPGGRGKRLGGSRHPGACAHYQGVLDPDPALAGQVDTGLDGDGNPVPQCTRLPVPDHRGFMDLQADAMAEPVLEMIAVPGRCDHVASRSVDRRDARADTDGRHPGPLRGGDQLVDLLLPRRGLADDHRPGHIRVIAAESGTAVNGHQVPGGKRPVGGHVVRSRAVRPAGDDAVEREPLGATVGHRALEQDRELPLGHARADRRKYQGERLAGDGAGAGEQLDLCLILDHPQLLHRPPERDQGQLATGRGEGRMPLHRHLLCLEGDPAQLAGDREADQRGLDEAVDEQLEIGAVAGSSGCVPEIGAQDALPVSGQQHGSVRAGQPRQVPDINQAGDKRRIRAERGDPRLSAGAAGGMYLGHETNCTGWASACRGDASDADRGSRPG